ncbi:MAG: hypothetical protein CL506_00650 [Actinobacteria bacterium]|nr:hypothetical protein [Actinomycetota bacterium]
MNKFFFNLFLFVSLMINVTACSQTQNLNDPESFGEHPNIKTHLDQSSVKDLNIDELIIHGQMLFETSFNDLDGLGRPETTGAGSSRPRREAPQNFNRISGPDAGSCIACHNLPSIGGGGDNAQNVFNLASDVDFVTLEGSVGSEEDSASLIDITNERNTVGVFGDGLIELLAREMSYDLLSLVEAGRIESKSKGELIKVPLNTKGVDFGYVIAHPSGYLDTSMLDGVDNDFIVRPFIQKGVISSLRDFSVGAMNHHHGMESEESVGKNSDADRDGVINELTEGDITAITLFQATLPFPKRKLPNNSNLKGIIQKGEGIFENIGCSACHVPNLPLKSLNFVEPGPFNPERSLNLTESENNLVINLGEFVGELEIDENGDFLIPLYSDLKRHNLGSKLDNERPLQKGVPTNYWLTRKLWGFYSEPPFLHHGRSSLLSDVIEMHQGDAKISSDAFDDLDDSEKISLIEFLKTFK